MPPRRRKKAQPASRGLFAGAFVVARINPIRFLRGAKVEFDETIQKMTASARRFKVENVKPEQVARAGGAAEE